MSEKLVHPKRKRFPKGHNCIWQYLKEEKDERPSCLTRIDGDELNFPVEVEHYYYRCRLCGEVIDISQPDKGTVVHFKSTGEEILWDELALEWDSYKRIQEVPIDELRRYWD